MYFKESSVFLVSIIFCIRTKKCAKLFTETMTEYFAHAQTVSTRLLLRWEGPRDEATQCTVHDSCSHHYICSRHT